jgi:hypothetical protein
MGITAVHEFIEAFNAQDHKRLAASLNYPHARLAKGRVVMVDSAEQFESISEKGECALEAEGWHHTEVSSLDVIHSTNDKEHISLRVDRYHQDGNVYNSFNTLWVATRVSGHWGIQFRSSFLT